MLSPNKTAGRLPSIPLKWTFERLGPPNIYAIGEINTCQQAVRWPGRPFISWTVAIWISYAEMAEHLSMPVDITVEQSRRPIVEGCRYHVDWLSIWLSVWNCRSPSSLGAFGPPVTFLASQAEWYALAGRKADSPLGHRILHPPDLAVVCRFQPFIST